MPASSTPAHDYVSPKTAAKLLAVHQTSIYRMVRDARLRAYRLGARFRLRRADVLDMLRPVHGDTTAIAACEPVQPVRPIPVPVVRQEPVIVKEPAPLMLSADEVAKRLDISTRTLWRMVEREEFPQPIRYNRKLVRWKTADVEAWLAEQMSQPAA